MQSILTVTGAAANYDLTDLATVKTELNISGTSEDTDLAKWITQASAEIAAYCGRVFLLESVTETFRSFGVCRPFDEVTLTRFPIATFSSVVEDGDTLTADTDYEFDRAKGILYRLCDGNPSRWNFRRLVVSYSGGYLQNALDENLSRACISLVRQLRSTSTRDPLVKSESIPGVLDTTYWVGGAPGTVGNLSPDIQAIIDPFRNVSV